VSLVLAFVVYLGRCCLVTLGILGVCRLLVDAAKRLPSPAENARRYTDDEGTW